MKRLLKLSLIPLSLLFLTGNDSAPTTNYEEKLPYMFKEPTWETYKHGDGGYWPLPAAPPYSTGLYTMASNNAVDYKEDSNKYFETAAKYKSTGNLEVYYKSNPSTAITTAISAGGKVKKTIGGDTVVEYDFPDTAVEAYNNTKAEHELVLDTSQGQWLVTNGMYSRNNIDLGIRKAGSANGNVINTTMLEPNPWGSSTASEFIKPEDFLMGLTKSIYGVQQSRPIYISTTPHRLAKKVTWYVVNPRNGDSCGPITWTYQTDDWDVRDVSYINPAWADQSPPACGQSKTIDRGEYIVHPEGYLNNVWYRYREDQNSFVSANTYELYFLKLLQKGILSIDGAFANINSSDAFEPKTTKSDNFTFAKSYGTQFYKEYRNYGRLVDGSSTYDYPSWAPELGALYTNAELTHKQLGENLTDKKINISLSGGSNLHQRALGINYDIHGSPSSGVTSIRAGKDQRPLMAKDTVTIINALRLIEKAMRVEQGDMSETEASIITQKYGAQYLDKLSDVDRQTVSYLLAKGVLNFENYQEYSNLYSALTQSFAYKLLYRIANEEARLKFTEVTLTDSFGLPNNYFELRTTISRANLDNLNKVSSVNPDGNLIKNDGEPLNLMSDVNFNTKFKIIEGSSEYNISKRYVITADVDDVLKYMYRNMPMVNINSSTKKEMYAGNNVVVYNNPKEELYNDLNNQAKRFVGINQITKNKDKDRFTVEFYAYGEDYESAVQFIKANISVRISNVVDKVEETGVKTDTGSTLTSQAPNDFNSSIVTNKDITLNKDYEGLSAYSNPRVAIAGNTVTKGNMSTNIGEANLTSTQHVEFMTAKTATDDVGQGAIVTAETSQIKGKSVTVKDVSGKTVGKTNILSSTVSSKPVTKGVNDFEEDFLGYNLSLLKSGDNLVSEYTFKYTDNEKKPATVKGNVVLSWELDLPSEKEQNSLVGLDVSPYINDNTKGSWLFTAPDNKALAEVWNYNVGLNNAILKTLTDTSLTIPSGYFVPKIDLLIDSVTSMKVSSTSEVSQDLSPKQIQEIKNNLAIEISKNLTSSWVKTYIGDVVLTNHIAGTNDSKIKEYIDKDNSTDKTLRILPSGKLSEADVNIGDSVWSGLVFGQNTLVKTDTESYFAKHTNRASYNTNTIFNTLDGRKYYGYYEPDQGEGSTESLVLPYAKDEFKNIFKNVVGSDYSYNEETEILKESDESYKSSMVGKTIKYGEQEWVVVNTGPYTIELHSKDFLTAMMNEGKLIQSTSGAFDQPEMMNVIHQLNEKTFGQTQEQGIRSEQFFKTQSFDFIPSSDIVDIGNKFAGISNGKLSPYLYTSVINPNDTTKVSFKLETTTLDEKEVIYVPQFVVLSKATWSINEGNLVWSKKFLGADPELYNRGLLLQSMKEQIITDKSENVVSSSTVKTGTLDVGLAKGTIQDNQVTFAVPFKSSMLNGTLLNESAVLEEFNMNSELTLTNNGDTASATQYLEDKQVGAYNPNYDLYHNTLVLIKGALKVVTGTTITDYTPSTIVDSVSLTSTLMEGIKLLNKGINNTHNDYKIYQFQDVVPSTLVSPFTNGAPPVLNADGTFVPDTAVRHQGLPTALELFDSIKKELNNIAAMNAWFLIVIILVGSGILLSITTLLAHIFAHSPVSNLFFSKLRDLIGVDFLVIMSIGKVSLDGENSWIRTLITSFTLGVIPITIFGIFKAFGLV